MVNNMYTKENIRKKLIAFRVSPELLKRIDEEAKKVGLTRTTTIEFLLRKAINLLPGDTKGEGDGKD